MKAKEYLSQVFLLNKRIDSKLAQLSVLKDIATKTTSVLGGDVVSHTRNVHGGEDVIIKIIDMENGINADIDHLVDLKHEVSQAIGMISSLPCQLVLEYRYLCSQSWEEIADTLGMHVRTIHKLHSRGLQEIDEFLKKSLS